jgi:hypothetical protein
MIHPSKPGIRSKATEKQSTISITEKLGCFWPIDNPKFEYDCNHNREETFDDEYPAPPALC